MNEIQENQIHLLWDELADFDISQSDAPTRHLLARLVEMSSASNATWAGALRMDGADENDQLKGWRVAAHEALHPVALQSEDGKHLGGIMDVWDRREIDPSFLLPLKGVGSFRTYSLRRDLPAEWFETPFYHRYYGSRDIYDLVLIAFPLNEDSESHIGFYTHEPFADETIAMFSYALRGIKWFHRHLMLNHGLLLAKAPLTPTEHKVMQFLLTGMAEKAMALQMGLAHSTIHQHVMAIYRKFGVRSRVALMNLWLNPQTGQ